MKPNINTEDFASKISRCLPHKNQVLDLPICLILILILDALGSITAEAIPTQIESGDAYVRKLSDKKGWEIGTALVSIQLKWTGQGLETQRLKHVALKTNWVDKRAKSDSPFFVRCNDRDLDEKQTYTSPEVNFKSEEDGSVILSLTLLHPSSDLRITNIWRAFPGTSVIGRQTILQAGKKPSIIQRIDSFRERIQLSKPFELSAICGEGGAIEKQDLKDKNIVLETKAGVSNNEYSPWFYLQDPESKGGVTGTIAWPGNWKLRFDSKGGGCLLSGGLSDWEFSHQLNPGETIESPWVYLAYFVGDENDAADELNRFALSYILRTPPIESFPPVHYDDYFTDSYNQYTGIKEKLQAVEVAVSAHCECYTMDAGYNAPHGWWDERTGWNRPAPKEFPDGLTPIIDACQKNHLLFGLWMEIENAGRFTPVIQAHPEWVSTRGGKLLNNRMGLDLTRPEVVAWVKSELDRVVREYHVGFLRFDFNHFDFPSEFGAGPEITDRPDLEGKNGLYIYYQNLLEILRWLRMRHPQLCLENCAAGGRRMNYALESLVDTNWMNDSSHPYGNLRMINSASRWLPIRSLQRWVTSDGVNKEGPGQDFGFHAVMMGHMGISLDLPKNLQKIAQRNVDLHKHLRQLIWNSKLFRGLGPAPESDDASSNWISFHYVARDGSASALFVFRPKNPDADKIVPVPGLRTDARYAISGTDGTYKELTGRELVEKGLSVQLNLPNTSVIYEFHCLAEPAGKPGLHPSIPTRKNQKENVIQKVANGMISGLSIRQVEATSVDEYGEIVELTWNIPKEGRPHHYEVFRGREKNFPLDAVHYIGSCAFERYIDARLEAGKTYYWAVCAANFEKGEERLSQWITLNIKPSPTDITDCQLWNSRWAKATYDSIQPRRYFADNGMIVVGDEYPMYSAIWTFPGTELIFDISKLLGSGKYFQFQTRIGISGIDMRGNVSKNVRSRFRVLADKKEIFVSNPMSVDMRAKQVEVVIPSGTQQLRLITEGLTTPPAPAVWIEPQIVEVR